MEEQAATAVRPNQDSFSSYQEVRLRDGRLLRRYDTGSVRVENPNSGVIQEERPDGSLVVSLPTGTVIWQEFSGEPLFVYHLGVNQGRPGLARVVSVALPGTTENIYVYHFNDTAGGHIVELETLRYFQVKRSA